MEFISVLMVQLLASGGSIVFGQTVAKNLLNHFSSHHAQLQKVLKICGKLMRYACIPIVVSQLVLAIVFDGSSRLWTVCALFGIVGAIIRFELAKRFNNGKYGWFPWGTFVANVSSTTIASVFFLLKYGLKDGQLLVTNKEASSMLQYLTLGFCGSLSTLSTFVYEGYNMPIIHASLYYFSSIAICFCISILIVGTYAWTHGILPTERLISV
ncbi:unnamed protein product [Kluyveromyces dobzhanskii CBS 2104]|uniref:WGS project CCBQ000000000 data, contig 00016 n=1 Tax=Kluyveromyces dobzhanskii CBS 2104 TaxID=1427455 RepID=A0A0A8L246_9SACH|nr:unnamed protein product [Kluyveromyces dobzhanskii CBS 2104]